MAQRILGLDPGLATLGFGVIELPPGSAPESAGVAVVDFGVVSTPAHVPVGDRLCIIYDDLCSLIKEFNPDQVIIEKFFFYRMGNTILVAQARGGVMLVLAQHQLS